MGTTTTGRAPRVAIYCRVSTSGQEENSSLATQEERCRAYAQAKGWLVAEVFCDVHTGAELFERPQMTCLRDRLRAGEIDMVVAYALDRLSRNQAHLGFLISELDHLDVRLALVTEELDDTPEGRLLQSVRSFVAEVERLKIAERTKRGRQARVANGRPIPGNKPPFGYQLKDETRSAYEMHASESVILRRIFDAVLGGKTLRQTARDLSREGIPTPSGRSTHWVISTLHTMLQNPIYAGRPMAYRTQTDRMNGKPRGRARPSSEWVPLPEGIAPPLLTVAEFESVQRRLERNRLAATRNNVNPEATLLRCGIARCGYCGYNLRVGRTSDDNLPVYCCNTPNRERYACPFFGVRAHILDAAVWDRVTDVLRDPDLIAIEVQRRHASQSRSDDLASFDRRLATIEKQRGRLARAVASLEDDEAVAPLLVELKQLAAEAQALSNERETILAYQQALEADTKQLASLTSWCNRVAENLQSMTYQEKRLVLEALGVSVHVFRSDHEPRWEINLAPPPIQEIEI